MAKLTGERKKKTDGKKRRNRHHSEMGRKSKESYSERSDDNKEPSLKVVRLSNKKSNPVTRSEDILLIT